MFWIISLLINATPAQTPIITTGPAEVTFVELAPKEKVQVILSAFTTCESKAEYISWKQFKSEIKWQSQIYTVFHIYPLIQRQKNIENLCHRSPRLIRYDQTWINTKDHPRQIYFVTPPEIALRLMRK